MNYLFVMLPDPSIQVLGMQRTGVAYVAGSLRAYGYPVFGLDCNLLDSKNPEDYAKAVCAAITEHDIGAVCVGAVSDEYRMVLEFTRLVKWFRPGILVIVGGGLITTTPRLVMENIGADFGIAGQGEETIRELADAIEGKRSFADVDGLVYKDAEGTVVINPKRRDIENLDDIPYPAYDLFGFERFLEQLERLNIIASRSCPYRCTFCYHTSGAKYVQRSLDSMFEEIDYWMARYDGIRSITVMDELFSYDKERLAEFCRRIKPYGVRFRANLRVDDVTPELLAMLKDAGCDDITYGLESADDRILKSMNKRTTAQQMETALRLTREAKLCGVGFFIFGDPAETMETANTSLQWWRENPQYPVKLGFIKIYPGTVLYEYARKQGIIADELDYLRQGIPIVNASRLSDSEFAWVGQQIRWSDRALWRFVEEAIIDSSDGPYLHGVVTCKECGHKTAYHHMHETLPKRVICENCGAELLFTADLALDARR